PIVDALCEEDIDLSRLRVVCDWVQYRHNFRDAIDIRPILSQVHAPNGASTNGAPPPEVEVAVDLRRCSDAPPGPLLRGALTNPARQGRLYLEPWTPGVDS